MHYIGLQDEDPSKFNFDFVASMLIKTGLALVYTDGSCPGCVMIMDSQGFGMGHAMNLNVSLLRKCLVYLQVRSVAVLSMARTCDRRIPCAS